MKHLSTNLTPNLIVLALLGALLLFLFPEQALASGALSGGGGSGLPYEEGVGAIWRSISEFVAPIAVALGVIIGIILFARGSAGSAIYSLFGFALIGGIALGITQIFSVFGWDGASIYPKHAQASAMTASELGGEK